MPLAIHNIHIEFAGNINKSFKINNKQYNSSLQ